MEKILFAKSFLKNWREVGSITPSSRFLAKKMVAGIDFAKANVIVELGPGSGIFTREILRKMKPEAKLILLETNHDFCENLATIDDERLVVACDSAMNMQKYLDGGFADYIVSGIPLANLSRENKDELLRISHNTLRSGGGFSQFQYTLESRKDLKKVFGKVKVRFVPLNVPPAFVYYCLKK